MAILKIKDNNDNVYEITSIKGDKGDTPINGLFRMGYYHQRYKQLYCYN